MSNDVIGFIEGSEFPDEYILVGNHRDSWVHGAVDPLRLGSFYKFKYLSMLAFKGFLRTAIY